MLGRRAREVDLDLVAGDRHSSVQLELALGRLEDVARLEPPVRQGRDPGPDASLRIGVELVHRGGGALAAVSAG